MGGETVRRGDRLRTSGPELACWHNKCSVLEWLELLLLELVVLEELPNLLRLLRPQEDLAVFLSAMSTGCMQVGQVKERMSQSSMQRRW